MQAKLNKITNWHASVIILAIGLATYYVGLINPFQGDDTLQIVNNIPVHSISNIKIFFTGGSFYYGQASRLYGAYYRPLQTTTFSLIYTLFGSHPFYYHLLQLLISIGSAIILYLFFRYSFKPALALFLALVFLIHPLNSQVVYAIPYMQDALFFFFGILALYLLLRFKSIRSLIAVAICLFLSLLGKESGMLFVAISLLYLFWWDRKRLYAFIGTIVLPIALWMILRFNAVGLHTNPHNAPIDNLSLSNRLLTDPSIILFYITKFIFPYKLASGYYWVHTTFSVRHVLVPLIVDLAVIGLFVYLAFVIRKRATKAMFYTFMFFAVWSGLGLILLLQIIPLDMTACETWFYFPMAGVLGMLGVVFTVFPLKVQPNWIIILAGIAIISILGFRTAQRGLEWRSAYKLALSDISVSPQNYNAELIIGNELVQEGNLKQAQVVGYRAVNIFPTLFTYNYLGSVLFENGDYEQARYAYLRALKYQVFNRVYENLGTLSVYYGNPKSNIPLLIDGLKYFPQDGKLWLCLAILDERVNNISQAKIAISYAVNYGAANQFIYNQIMNNKPLVFTKRPVYQ